MPRSAESFTLISLYTKELRIQGIDVPLFTIAADISLLESADGKADGTISVSPPQTGLSLRELVCFWLELLLSKRIKI